LVFGGAGWIGGQIVEELRKGGYAVSTVQHPRADDTAAVSRLLDEAKPDRVVCLVGRTHGPGFPTIDYLEQPGKLVENVKDNLYAPVSLALLCKERGIHMTYMGTGCIFEYDAAEHREESGGVGFKEADLPNFFGSSYSVVKGFTDRLMHLLEGSVLNVRIRMPIVAAHHPRNFITKITSYAKVCSIPNSMTVLPTLLPRLVDLIGRGDTGTINLTNPGVISHNEILEMYREIVDPAFTWTNFSVEEQNTILASRRSNNLLDTGRLESLCPDVPNIRDAVRACLVKMGEERRRGDVGVVEVVKETRKPRVSKKASDAPNDGKDPKDGSKDGKGKPKKVKAEDKDPKDGSKNGKTKPKKAKVEDKDPKDGKPKTKKVKVESKESKKAVTKEAPAAETAA
jgi:3,5-epimerase/4-reductase